MIPVAAIQARLRAEVTDLHRIEGAADMQALMKAQGAMTTRPLAHVVTTGLRANPAMDAAGAHVQMVTAGFSVVLTIPATADPKGERGRGEADPLIQSIVLALIGWTPEAPHVVGPCSLVKSSLARFDAEMQAWAIDFTLPLYLRT